ncbi:CehA/McbA family metallohydrolase [Paenibacillus radicis (ex Xue et al. 2023)]|uniref:CehA/McbA family metallohydrolase n=1 Tax=Paenibacillus radicis (ex Xue et al. 2023) TaxID=2972489 RepID=A0ABT1YES9_9BACL|nr:CehA/McbA family metallohydrolase [Paenibacillus radicis (ex Xue et al. 2023)]MCR8631702.1 CehA/McbA family metallohydrolase [Paenibacillus radicis (ex Xue et al. 2023)]
MKKVEPKRTISIFSLFIEHAQQGTYVELPFDMPSDVEEIRVGYIVEAKEGSGAVIDLGIRDSHRVRGWSGGARTYFNLGLEKATPGYLPGPLSAGSWAVLHNAYKIPQDGCTVKVTIEFTYATQRWLKGDLHTHSINSDGSYTLEENAGIMEQLGCDFIAMTDHNTSSQNLSYPRDTSVVMIPGYEFTTNFGHSNFLGVTDPLDDFRVSNQADVNDRLGVARERGAKIVLNHPHCDYCPWEWDFQVDHDWVEVWNGPWTMRNEHTLNWWQQQLVSGRRLTAIGGSDVHRPDPFVKHAMPCTWVFASSKTVEGILNGVDKGHVLISYSPEGPFVELECGSYKIGEVVPESERSRTIRLQAENLKAGDKVKLISSRGVEQEVIAPDGENGMVELRFEADHVTFVRAEVWRHFKETDSLLMAALTNPIYFD